MPDDIASGKGFRQTRANLRWGDIQNFEDDTATEGIALQVRHRAGRHSKAECAHQRGGLIACIRGNRHQCATQGGHRPIRAVAFHRNDCAQRYLHRFAHRDLNGIDHVALIHGKFAIFPNHVTVGSRSGNPGSHFGRDVIQGDRVNKGVLGGYTVH